MGKKAMSCNSSSSPIEELMIEVLAKSPEPLTLVEIVQRIRKIDSQILSGKTPTNSLYSVLFRRESRRKKAGAPEFFVKDTKYRVIRYSLNKKVFKKIS